MKFGILVPIELRVKLIQQREQMSALELWDNYLPISLLKVGVGSPFSFKYPLMGVWSIWELLTSTGPLGPFEMLISWLPLLLGEGIQPGGPYGSVAVPWIHPVPVHLVYIPKNPENARAAARRVHDDHL